MTFADQLRQLDKTELLHELYTTWLHANDATPDEDAAIREALARAFQFEPDPQPVRPPLYPFPLRAYHFTQKALYWYDAKTGEPGDARRIKRVLVKPTEAGYYVTYSAPYEGVSFDIKASDVPLYVRNDPRVRTLLPSEEDARRYDQALAALATPLQRPST